jgi:hypothetical protein
MGGLPKGQTVLRMEFLFSEPGTWRLADDILDHTPEGIETLVRLGDTVALKTSTRARATD